MAFSKPAGSVKVRVAILDDHVGMIESYRLHLGRLPQVEIVGVVHYGAELESLLARAPADVLLLDVRAPTAVDNPALYPVVDVIPRLQQRHPGLAIIVISQVAEASLVRSFVKAGVRGYILKDDTALYERLESVIMIVVNGGTCYSQKISDLLSQRVERLLTPRQQQALSLIAAYPEWTKRVLAEHMGISHSTARTLLSQAYDRLGVENDAAAILKAQELGLITPLEHFDSLPSTPKDPPPPP